MPRIDDGLIGQRKEHALDAFEELRPTPAGEVRTPDAPVKENVTVEQDVFPSFVETDVTWCVSGGVEHLKAQLPYKQVISIMEFQIWRRAGRRCFTNGRKAASAATVRGCGSDRVKENCGDQPDPFRV